MNVSITDEQDDPLELTGLAGLARTVLEAEGVPEASEVAIVFVSPSEISSYNERYLGGSGPTDVLAFPIEDLRPGDPIAPGGEGPPLQLGDVLIAPSIVKANAEKADVAFEDELALMVVHGLLHLLGYDHQPDSAADEMEARERTLLAAVGRVRP